MSKSTHIKPLITELFELEAYHEQQLDKIKKEIQMLQNMCEHVDNMGVDMMEEIGHDSHKDHFKCKICGYRESV